MFYLYFREQRDNRVMMARLTVDGCQKDYICFEFVPQHHNIIRCVKQNFNNIMLLVCNLKEKLYCTFFIEEPVK